MTKLHHDLRYVELVSSRNFIFIAYSSFSSLYAELLIEMVQGECEPKCGILSQILSHLSDNFGSKKQEILCALSHGCQVGNN